MKHLFATHGIPEKLMTDNGSQFVSHEFEQFAKEWNFVHTTSSPYYPKSNGLAENAVKQAKQLLNKSKKDGSDMMLGLLNLRQHPKRRHGVTGTAPTIPTHPHHPANLNKALETQALEHHLRLKAVKIRPSAAEMSSRQVSKIPKTTETQ
ncbi:uncharacterized protein [Littorina saxatilis]|uniref:uncharacterized protein n=1 Tax=Littorina saxatilis TaxID=31220 RepID=UPI0038B489BC